MTVIVWDGVTLAADRRAVAGLGIYTISKIARCGDRLVGVSGRGDKIREFQQWVRDGRKLDAYPEREGDDCHFTAIAIAPDGTIERYEDSPHPIVVEDATHAIGSGGILARVALHLGKSAAEAVEIAGLFDEQCGSGIDVLSLADLE